VIPKEILKQVRQIQIKSNRLVNDIFAGEYHSAFKGRGIEFSGVREYQVGDEIRSIDWNVTARTGFPFVKYYIEERELTVMLMVDVSSSGKFGSIDKLKREITAELCSALAFSAINNKDKIGLILFSDRIEKFIPPQKGKTHALRIIRELLFYKPERDETNLKIALEYLNMILKRKSVAFLVSDFLCENLFEKELALTNKRHDLIAIKIVDPREIEIPDVGFIQLEDAETGEIVFIDSGFSSLRENYKDMNSGETEKISKLFKSLKIDLVEIQTDKPYINSLLNFFRARGKRL